MSVTDFLVETERKDGGKSGSNEKLDHVNSINWEEVLAAPEEKVACFLSLHL